jgi:hypothetical protein
MAILDVHFHKVNSKQIGLFQTNQCCFFGQNFRIVAKEKEKEIQCVKNTKAFFGKKEKKVAIF